MLLSNWLTGLRGFSRSRIRGFSRRAKRRQNTPRHWPAAEKLEDRTLLAAPVAVDDSYSVDEDTTLNQPAAGVLTNDSDPDEDPITAALVSDVSNGSLTLNTDGSFVYTPDTGFTGQDSFTYKAEDIMLESSNVATVTIDVTAGGGGNNAPDAADDSYNVDYDQIDTFADSLLSVLDNDTDLDADPLTVTLVTGPNHGSLTLNSDGHFIFDADSDFEGVDSFVYEVSDGTDTDTATATLNITKPFGAQTNATDSPWDSAVWEGAYATDFLTGDAQVVVDVAPQFDLMYRAIGLAQPIISVDTVFNSGNLAMLDQIDVSMTLGGVASDTMTYHPALLDNGEEYRFVSQVDASSLATGRYAYQVDVVAHFGNKTATRRLKGYHNLLNLTTSEFGVGWTLTDLDRLVIDNDGALFVRGDGSMAYFTDNGDSTFTSPSGPMKNTTLVQNIDLTYTLEYKSGNKSHFDTDGLLTQREDRNGNTTDYTYQDADSDGKTDEIQQITDPFGRNTDFNFTSGLLSSVDDLAARTTTLAHDASSHLTSVTSPDPDDVGPLSGSVTAFAYQTDGLLTQITDPNGNITTLSYDFAGRLDQAVQPDGGTRNYAPQQSHALIDNSTGYGTPSDPAALYFTEDTMAAWTDTSGNNIEVVTDEFGFVTSFKNEANIERKYDRNSDGAIMQVFLADPDGAGPLTGGVFVYDYDSDGNVTEITDPNGKKREWQYDAEDRPVVFIDRRGQQYDFEYDLEGNLTKKTDPLGRSTGYQYDPSGRVTKITGHDPDGPGPEEGPVIEFAYDWMGRRTSKTDPDGFVTGYQYDAADNVTKVTDKLGRETEFEYDALDRLILITNPNGGTIGYQYDEKGNVTSIEDELGNITQFAYDWMGRRTSETDAKGKVRQWEYDLEGNLKKRIDKNGFETGYTYDSRKRLTKVTDPLGNWFSYGYDDQDNVTSITDKRGKVTEFEYDAKKRRTKMIDALDNEYDYSYDDEDNLKDIYDDWNRNWHYDYDAKGRVTSKRDADGQTVQYAYDDYDNVKSITDKRGNVTQYEYDDLGRRTKKTDALGNDFEYAYDAEGNLTQFTDALDRNTQFSYDSQNRRISKTDADGGVIQYSYDAAGSITSLTDELGNVTQFTYDDVGRQETTTDALGGVTTTAYDNKGRVISVTDALGRVTQFAYDDNDQLTSTTDALGNVTSFAYDASGNLTSTTDALGNITSFTYDDLNRRITTTDALGGVTTTAIDLGGRVTSVTDALGRTTSFAYDNVDRMTSRTDALGNVTSYAYDAAGNMTSTTDALGNVTSFGYDALNRRTSITDALAGVTQMTFSATGQVTQVTDPLGRSTQFAYDNLDRMTSQTDPLGNVTSFAYDVASNLISTTDALGFVTLFAYDALNRRTSTTDALGGVYQTAYDAVGNRTSATDPLGNTTTFAYDDLNRLTSQTDPLTNVTQYAYDAVGNLTSITDPNAAVTSFAYDAVGQRTSTTDSLGGVVQQAFNLVGNLTSLTDAGGNKTTFVYDDLNRLTSETNAESNSRQFTYDAVSNLISRTDRNGRVTEFDYDALVRPVEERWKDGATTIETITFTYDAASQLLSASDSNSAYAFAYDLAGRLTSVDNAGTTGSPNLVLTSTFDAVGNRTSVDATVDGTADFANDYTYDALGRMTHIEQTSQSGGNSVADKSIDITYSAIGQFDTITRYADLAETDLVATTDYDYDSAGRLTNLDHDQGATSLASYSWTFDANGRITNSTSVDGTVDYTYDSTGQLTSADHSYQSDENYTYDANGNRTNTGYSTGTNNRLLSDGTYDYEYDDEGNRTKKTEIATGDYVEYTWDHRNRLTKVEFKDSANTVLKTVEYTYDVFNRRIAKKVDDDGDGTFDRSQQFLYDNAGKVSNSTGTALDDIVLIYEDSDGDGPGTSTLSSRVLHGPAVDQVFAEETSSGDIYWALADNQGTIRDIAEYDSASDTTSVANHLTYDAFGNITSETDATVETAFEYTGREFDADIDLYYYRARWYDAAVGRFISEDPIGFAAGDTNIQRYVGNSPTNYIDPTGHQSLTLDHFGRPESMTAYQIGAEMDEWVWFVTPSDPDHTPVPHSPAHFNGWGVCIYPLVPPPESPKPPPPRTVLHIAWDVFNANVRAIGNLMIAPEMDSNPQLRYDYVEYVYHTEGEEAAEEARSNSNPNDIPPHLRMEYDAQAEMLMSTPFDLAPGGQAASRVDDAAPRRLGPAGSGTGNAAGQLTDRACGMACGQRMLGEQGVTVFQSNLTKGFYKGLSPEALAKNMNQFQPGWTGKYAYPKPEALSALFNSRGKFIARLGGNPGHFVTVESIKDGIVRFWDPNGGVFRSMPLDEFQKSVSGVVHR